MFRVVVLEVRWWSLAARCNAIGPGEILTYEGRAQQQAKAPTIRAAGTPARATVREPLGTTMDYHTTSHTLT